jgi:hypothetical protein
MSMTAARSAAPARRYPNRAGNGTGKQHNYDVGSRYDANRIYDACRNEW